MKWIPWILILLLCAGGIYAGLRIRKDEEVIGRMAGDLSDLEAQRTEAREKAEEVARNFDELESAVAQFGDGETSWRDVVPDVESATSDLSVSVGEVTAVLEESSDPTAKILRKYVSGGANAEAVRKRYQ